MSDRMAVSREFERRITEISRYDFVQRYVCSSLPECQGSNIREGDYEVEKIQNDGTGPATIRLAIRGSTMLFGKLYRDNSGAHAENVLRNLRNAGFGGNQHYQVAEPLFFMPEHNLLLTRAASGACLDSNLGQDGDPALNGVREAARWLAKLHNSPVRIGSLDGPWYMFTKLSARLAKAAASHPQELRRLISMLSQMERSFGESGPADPVQTHGQYRPIHVFLTRETVTLVDLDRSRPSDPAKDLAEFIHRLRTTVFHKSSRMDHADQLTSAFLEEYKSLRFLGIENLAFYRCFHVLVSFCRQIKSLKADDPEWERTIDFYSDEFEHAMTSLATKHGSSRNLRETANNQVQERLEDRVEKVTQPEFIEKVVYPALGNGTANASPTECEVTLVQNRGTGRVTLKYLFENEAPLFGKLYSDETAQHGFQVLKELWESNFGEGEPFQVSQPLLHLPAYGFLLLRGVEGTPLASLVGRDGPDLVRYVKQAAQWLARLHSSPLRVGRSETLWHSLKFFKLVRRLAKATAVFPAERKRLTGMIDALCESGKQVSAKPPLVQTHGRFHYEHVLFNGSTTSVIDFDRSFPSDPAKDLAEFLSMLRRKTFKLTGNTADADAPARAFIEEYLSRLPGNATTLQVHWGAFLLLTMFRDVRKHAANLQSLERITQFYRGEFDAVLSGKLVTDGVTDTN